MDDQFHTGSGNKAVLCLYLCEFRLYLQGSRSDVDGCWMDGCKSNVDIHETWSD